MSGQNIVYFDLETQRSFSAVGGAANKHKMGVSVAVTFSTARGGYEIYPEDEMHLLGEELMRADLVVGWNHLQFDYPVLQSYLVATLDERTRNLDMMLDLEKRLGFRLKLDSAASATLGVGKTGDGLDALRWWQEHKHEEQKLRAQAGASGPQGKFCTDALRKIATYCAYDVKVTMGVHQYGVTHGHIKYHDRNKRIVEVEVDWGK